MAGEQAPNLVAVDYRIDPEATPDFDVTQHLYLAIPLQALKREGEPQRQVPMAFLERLVDANFTPETTHLRSQWDVALAGLRGDEEAQVTVVGPDDGAFYLEVPRQRSPA